MLKIYYCAPVSGGGFSRDVYAAQISYLKRFGKVLTEHLASDSAVTSHDAKLEVAGVYAQDAAWLAEADVIVADVTFPSTGTGVTLGAAVAQHKKIVALFDSGRGKASALVAGCPGIFTSAYTSVAEWQSLVRFFVLPSRVYLFGPPGSGKGTLASWLGAKLGLQHISTGDILRSYLKEKAGTDDPLAKELSVFMDAGQLVPAAIMAAILAATLHLPAVRRRGFILDGYPPSLEDAAELRRSGIFPTSVLVLDCPSDTAISRQVTRAARSTDKPDTAAERVRVYHEQTERVLSTFPSEMRLNIDATQPIEGVRSTALGALLDQFQHLYLKWATGSYILTPGTCTNPRFHSHVDAVSHVYLRDALSRVTRTASTVKLYPVSDLELGPQAATTSSFAPVYSPGGGTGAASVDGSSAAAFSQVYKRLANFHRIAGNPVDEAFATVQMGDSTLDYPQLASSLEVAASYTDGEVLVETEENVFEAEVDVESGKVAVGYDLGETPFTVDWSQLPSWAAVRALPAADKPRFELHHGFDIAKTSECESRPPLDPTCVVAAMSGEEGGMENGGWFVFAKPMTWAYRCNEFSNDDYAPCVARLVKQAEHLHSWLAKSVPPTAHVLEAQTCSLEKVLAMWPFQPE